MRKMLFPILLTLLAAAPAGAQDDPEYRMEIGAAAGGVNYEGDFNGNLFGNMQPMGGLLWRYNFNPSSALRVMVGYGKLKGNSGDVETYYPDLGAGNAMQRRQYAFDNGLVDVSVTYEYNFWPYGTGRDYRGAKRLTPFLFGGIGATHVSGGGQTAFTANIPIGIGLKYKVAERVNVGVEWTMHFSLSDKLDGVADPYGIESSGLFKNTDCYSALLVTLSYSFSAKCRTCNKD